MSAQTKPPQLDWLIRNARVATLSDSEHTYGALNNATIGLAAGKIAVIESDSNAAETLHATNEIDAQRQWLTPGLIDCHTHLVFGGNRAQEFEWRLQGESYQTIAQRGGGIVSTVNATRTLSQEALFEQSAPRLERLLEEGVTTVEIKSGYGLNLQHETAMLTVARRLGEEYPVTVRTTFLGAHAVPPEFQAASNPKQAYIDHVCQEMLPAIAESGLADAVDVFCEGIGFSVAQCEQVFRAAQAFQLPIKGHVEQLSNLRGAVAAAKHHAMSVDHIEYLANDDVHVLKDTVAVLLPAAFYFLHETQKPPVNALRAAGVAMAVASDLNPGTAPMASLLNAMNQACVLFDLTPEEALRGATCHAARALKCHDKGVIRVGADADLALWGIDHPAELSYAINFHRPTAVWQDGKLSKQARMSNA
ncbi:imidazolonepropionase [Arenicella chitinivorans]|uniref:Imidazolonepropionase n=1 Tax=Arenicella chitinivorans TaxID=1329800 RepID=A0A918RG50_9GAMM|nr:imidazolonepropionase [Arenicella chitinivorans]GGZ97481.1 imidazolonepropionase [Arenicella chitinivorans]